jgi:hypothetical protein
MSVSIAASVVTGRPAYSVTVTMGSSADDIDDGILSYSVGTTTVVVVLFQAAYDDGATRTFLFVPPSEFWVASGITPEFTLVWNDGASDVSTNPANVGAYSGQTWACDVTSGTERLYLLPRAVGLTWPARGGAFNILGKADPVVVADVRQSPTIQVEATWANLQAMTTAVGSLFASGHPIFVMGDLPPVPEGLYWVGDVSAVRPSAADDRWVQTLPLTQVEAVTVT